MINGVINIRKEKGMTSFGVVAYLRKIFGQKKIGHTGTLDPDAEGVLPVCFGRATHLVNMLSEGTKGYQAVILLGMTTDTQDAGGKILSTREVCVSEDEVREVVNSFVGQQKQLPPMYSAIKMNGKKLVDLARRGIEVERRERDVTFYEIKILEMKLPRISISVTCSHGTYIRTLCNDIGETLGCGGCMESLIRTRSGDFSLEDALTLSEIRRLKELEDEDRGEPVRSEFDQSNAPYSFMRSIDYFYRDHVRGTICREALQKALSGCGFSASMVELSGEVSRGECIRLYTPEGKFIGIYKKKEDGFHLVSYFYEDR